MSFKEKSLPKLPDLVGRTNWLPFRQAGPFIFISGLCGTKEDGSACSDSKEQLALAYKNFDAVLKEAGIKREDVVMFNQYIGDRMYVAECLRLRDEFFGTTFPACNDVVVTLGHPTHFVELQGIAYVDVK